MKKILLLLLLSCSCSTLIDSPNPQVICRSSEQICPASSEALTAVLVFQEKISPEFSVEEKLIINWYGQGEIPRADGSEVVGQTQSRYELDTIGFRPLFHELAHVDFWRRLDDPDYNHAESPGPWGPELEEQLRQAYLEAGY